MVSNFKYNSFKEVNWNGKVPFVALLIIMLIFVVVATEPALVLFLVFALYALAGPINTFRTVDKMTLHDVVGDHEEKDADFTTNEESVSSEQESVNSDNNNNKKPE